MKYVEYILSIFILFQYFSETDCWTWKVKEGLGEK